LVAGAWYTGFETAHASGTNGIGTFTLNETNSTIKVMVYKDVISKVGIKFARPDGSTGEISVTNTKINEWEELTFNFAGKIGVFLQVLIKLLYFQILFQKEQQDRRIMYVMWIISLFCKNSGSSCCHCAYSCRTNTS
jgi:dipeptide/tripeptide permease